MIPANVSSASATTRRPALSVPEPPAARAEPLGEQAHVLRRGDEHARLVALEPRHEVRSDGVREVNGVLVDLHTVGVGAGALEEVAPGLSHWPECSPVCGELPLNAATPEKGTRPSPLRGTVSLGAPCDRAARATPRSPGGARGQRSQLVGVPQLLLGAPDFLSRAAERAGQRSAVAVRVSRPRRRGRRSRRARG